MHISQQKLKENIAEYVLYMYQIEDLIRSYKFDLEAIYSQFISKQVPSEAIAKQYKDWYADLINQMDYENIKKSGHLSQVREVHMELAYLHNALLEISADGKYKGLVDRSAQHIEEFRKKSDLGDIHPVEVAFHALYMKLLLKLQGKEISAETEDAFDSMRILLAFLAKKYKLMKSGDENFLNN